MRRESPGMKKRLLSPRGLEITDVYGRLWETKTARLRGTSLKLCVLSSLAIPAVTGSLAAAGARMSLWGTSTQRLQPSWSVWELAGGSACSIFLAWTLAALEVSKLEHTDQNTMTFGTISSCPLFCLQSREGEPSLFALALAPCRTGLS